jgi:hypothetical protein
MIKFDAALLTSDYVYIAKITSTFVYVVCDRDMKPYNKGVDGTFLDFNVKKVRINQSVYMRFMQMHSVREFRTPRLATLNMYGDNIVSIETQKYDYVLKGFESADTWRSTFDMTIDLIKEKVEKLTDEVFINGESIFWLNKHDRNSYDQLNARNSLRLYHAHAIKLYSIGAKARKKSTIELSAKSFEVKEDDNGEVKAVLSIHAGKMLAFIPNPDAPVEEQIVALSPLLETRKVRSASGMMKNVNFEERAAYIIGSENNPCYTNLEFVLQAARVIGKLYGNDAIDFLNIPRILKSIGQVNITKVHEQSRTNVPIEHTAESCIAWILGFIYRETDMNKIAQLNKMFRFIMNSGLVQHKDIEILTVRNAENLMGDFELPLNSEKVNAVLEKGRASANEENDNRMAA